jgi:hypothetical protein
MYIFLDFIMKSLSRGKPFPKNKGSHTPIFNMFFYNSNNNNNLILTCFYYNNNNLILRS